LNKKKFKIAVLISGNGSNLQSLIDESFTSDCLYEISCVISNNPNAFGLVRAKKNNIFSLVVNHKDYEQRKDFDLALEREINNIDVDLIVLAGFMRILGKSIIKKYHNRIINLHPSLLPKYPGLNTHLKVLQNGDTYHGATVHLVDEGLDTGKIIGFSKFETNAQDSLDSLLAKTHEVEHKLLPKICCLIASGKIKLDKGDVLIEDKSYKKGKEFIF